MGGDVGADVVVKSGEGDAEAGDEGEEVGKNDEAALDGDIIDESAPLSFQFRPELRQVEVAVELLNKNPNPPVHPILRDTPSVKEAKAKAREEEAALKGEGGGEDAGGETGGDGGEDAAEMAAEVPAKAKDGEEEEALSVENFNGIPVFQARALTFLQNKQQRIPLFFSKQDLYNAWEQLVATPGSGVSGECVVEVGTLEDVLRRMSEAETAAEFVNVMFVPSSESMAAIGQSFPSDDNAAVRSRRVRAQLQKPVTRKASFSKAKDIKARGGTQKEIRAAFEKDLQRYRT